MKLQSRLAETQPLRKPDFGLAQVNIVLLLVLFFLVVGTIVETDELTVDLPTSTDLPLERLPRPLLLINLDGSWSLDGQPGTKTEIVDRLKDDSGSADHVHILTAANLPASQLLAAVQALQPTGLGVTLVTLKAAP